MVMPDHNLNPYEENRDLMFGTDKELNIYLQHATYKEDFDTFGYDNQILPVID